MSWVADAPTGVYKNHSLSRKIRDAAVANAVFLPFCDTEPNFGKGKGDTHTITRVHNLPLASTVGENSELPSGRPLIDTKSVTVSEWGYKVKLTEFETNLTHFDLQNKVQRALRDQLRLTMDKMACDALKSTPIKVRSTSASALSFTTNGTVSGNSTNNLNGDLLGQMRDYLSGDLKAPTFADGNYVLIATPKALRGIKQDTTYYQGWMAPTTRDNFVRGEIGTIEGIRIIETNHFDALDNSIASGVTGEAILFGADATFMVTADEPELRRGVATDLGRFYDVGWVGTTQAGLVWDTASTARAIHWTSTTL